MSEREVYCNDGCLFLNKYDMPDEKTKTKQRKRKKEIYTQLVGMPEIFNAKRNAKFNTLPSACKMALLLRFMYPKHLL